MVLFLDGFCFVFFFSQGFVLVPSNPETPSKSRDFFSVQHAQVSFSSRLEMMVRDVQFGDARCMIREAQSEYKSACDFRSSRTRSSPGAAFRLTYSN